MAEALKHVPFIGKIIETMGDEWLQNANCKGLTVPVEQSATDQGITLTVKEVMYDGIRLFIGMEEHSGQPLPPNDKNGRRYAGLDNWFKATVNGEDFGWLNGERVSMTEDGHAVSMLEIEPHGEPGPGEKRLADKLGDSFTLQVEIPQVGAVKGRWVLQIPVQKQGMYTTKQTPMLEKKLGNITMLMRSVASSPRGIELNFHTILPANDKQAYQTVLGMAFTATDEHGYPLDSMGGGGNMYGDETIWETTLSYSPLPESSKEIVLKPYRSLGKKGAG